MTVFPTSVAECVLFINRLDSGIVSTQTGVYSLHLPTSGVCPYFVTSKQLCLTRRIFLGSLSRANMLKRANMTAQANVVVGRCVHLGACNRRLYCLSDS